MARPFLLLASCPAVFGGRLFIRLGRIAAFGLGTTGLARGPAARPRHFLVRLLCTLMLGGVAGRFRSRRRRFRTPLAARVARLWRLDKAGAFVVARIHHVRNIGLVARAIRILAGAVAVLGVLLMALLTTIAVGTVAIGVATLLAATLVVLLLAGFLLARLLALRLTQHAGVMFGVLQEVLFGHAVIRQLRIARKHQVFVDDLLGGATHLAFRPRTVKDAVDDIANRALAVRLGTRTGFG